MAMSYGYDAVGNIKTLANAAAVPTSITKGGATAYSFGYDDLYQLTSSTGAFAKPGMATQKFTLAMAYDGIHNITHKTQTAFNLLSNGSTTPNVALSYDYPYAYAGGRPHATSQAGNHAFLYDLDGNQAGWNATNSYQNRRMTWDEDGRLQSVIDNGGQPTTFKYDGDTNRVVKKGAGGETLYINPWYVAALGRNSKQIFAGTTRIVTKLEISPTGEGYGPGAKNLKEVAQYFYHPDHLGSTGFATDATGEVWQHLEYFPFGETWVDEVSDDARVPYRFTGQELDQETKLYYYGARYYDPRTSAWESADPALGGYLNAQHNKGVYQPRNLSSFAYTWNNPVRLTDPNGRWIDDSTAEGRHEADRIAISAEERRGEISHEHADLERQAVNLQYELQRPETWNAAFDFGIAESIASSSLAGVFLKLDALPSAGPAVAAAIAPQRPPIVIGEGMKRVEEYAKQIGAEHYNPWARGSDVEATMMRRNKRWINEKKGEGRDIIDIGPDFKGRLDFKLTNGQEGRTPSKFYNMEREQLKGYDNVQKVWKREGPLGGVPGLDP